MKIKIRAIAIIFVSALLSAWLVYTFGPLEPHGSFAAMLGYAFALSLLPSGVVLAGSTRNGYITAAVLTVVTTLNTLSPAIYKMVFAPIILLALVLWAAYALFAPVRQAIGLFLYKRQNPNELSEASRRGMSIKGVLLRFMLAYVAVVFAAGIALNYFGVKNGSWVNIAALAACISWVCTAFGKANGRYFTSSEKTAVVIGSLGIDLALQFMVSVADLPQGPSQVNSGALVFALIFVGVLHAVAIYLFVGMTGKSLAKQGVISD